MLGSDVIHQINRHLSAADKAYREQDAVYTNLSNQLNGATRKYTASSLSLCQILTANASELKGVGKVGQKIQTLLNERAASAAQHMENLNTFVAQRKQLESQVDQANTQHSASLRELNSITKTLKNVFLSEERPAFVQAQIEDFSIKVARAKSNLEAAKKDMDEKLPHYHEDIFFMYLKERNFGTSDYAGSGIFKILDRWVAGLTHYSSNFQNYTQLKEVPTYLSNNVANIESKLAPFKSEFEKGLSSTYESNADYREKNQKEHTDHTALKNLNQSLKQCNEQIALITNAQHDMEQGKDRHTSAISSHILNLIENDLEEVKRLVEKTANSKDDSLLNELWALGQEMQELSLQIEKTTKSRNTTKQKRDQIAEFKRDFERKNYNSSDIEIRNLNTQSIDQFMTTMALASFMTHVNRHSEEIPRHNDNDHYGGGGFGGGSSGSSFGGGGFSTGSSFGGGGFKTGSGF